MLNFYLKAYTFSIGNCMLVDSYNSFVPVPFFNTGLLQDHSTADDTANGLAF